jgi:hypothetical protein
MAGAADEEKIGAELHALMVKGDVTAPARIAEFFLPLLVSRLMSKKIDQEIVDTVSVRPFTRRVMSMTEQLVCTFGLPATIAKAYCSALLTSIGKGPSWAESLR